MLSHCIAYNILIHYHAFYNKTKNSKEIKKICPCENNFFHDRKYLSTTRRRDNRKYIPYLTVDCGIND